MLNYQRVDIYSFETRNVFTRHSILLSPTQVILQLRSKTQVLWDENIVGWTMIKTLESHFRYVMAILPVVPHKAVAEVSKIGNL